MHGVVLPEEVMPAGPPPGSPRAHIGVVAPLNFPDMTEEIAVLVRELISTTLSTLWDLGATFELLDPSTDMDGAALPEGCDGLLLLGGGDIDPSCYTRVPLADVDEDSDTLVIAGPDEVVVEMPGSYGVDLRTDRQSLDLIGEAERSDKPILGVCRGHQLLNVYRGGTIIPDIDDPTHIHHGAEGESLFLTETITLLEGTRLQSIFGDDALNGWTAHHQAVDQLGAGLIISARATDNVVEGIEDPTRWILGVQWHPERANASAEDRRKLFGALVDECAARRAGTAAPEVPVEHG